MKRTVLWTLVFALMFVAAPAFSGEATQMWKCEMDDDATEEQVKARAQAWLKAAKKLNGGENFKAYVFFPVAVNGMGETDLMFVVVAPSFEDWGKFWDAYAESPVNVIDNESRDLIACPDSVLWESYKVE
jgi:hypothetical protein